MKEIVFISANKEAAPKVRSGSYADGFADQSVRLPFTVMGSHVNLPATGHSEMASDIDRFSGCFLHSVQRRSPKLILIWILIFI